MAEVHGRRWGAFAAMNAAVSIVMLDSTIVNVALPQIAHELALSHGGLVWIVDAYLIAFTGTLLIAGRAGDVIGRRRMFLAGVSSFAAASVVCGIAPSVGILIAGRVVQGVGGAAILTATLAIVTTLFHDAREREKAVAVYSVVLAVGATVGLLLGGAVTDAFGWRWSFFINVPVGALAVALVIALVCADRPSGLRRRLQARGAALVASGLMVAVYGVVAVAERGWASSEAVGGLGVGAALLAGFVWSETRESARLVPLTVLRSRQVTAASLILILTVPALGGVTFLGALYFRGVLGYGALEAGLAFLPLTIATGVVSIGRARVVRGGMRYRVAAGLLSIVIGLVWLGRIGVRVDYAGVVLPAFVLIGAGTGLVVPSALALAMAGATGGNAGVISGIANTAIQGGGALGVAVLSTVAGSRTNAMIDGGTPWDVASTAGYGEAYVVAACLVVGALVVTAWTFTGPQRRE